MVRIVLRAIGVLFATESTYRDMNLGQRQSIINRAQWRRKPSSSTKGNNNGKAPTYRSYCPYCNPNHTDPERSTHVSVVAGHYMVTGSCKHSWQVGGASHSRETGGLDDHSFRLN